MASSYPVKAVLHPPFAGMPDVVFIKIPWNIGWRLEWSRHDTPFRMTHAYPVRPVHSPPIHVMPNVLFVEIAPQVDGAGAMWKPAKPKAHRSELRRCPERRHACGLRLHLRLCCQQAEDQWQRMLNNLACDWCHMLCELAEVKALRSQLRSGLEWQQAAESAEQIADLPTKLPLTKRTADRLP